MSSTSWGIINKKFSVEDFFPPLASTRRTAGNQNLEKRKLLKNHLPSADVLFSYVYKICCCFFVFFLGGWGGLVSMFIRAVYRYMDLIAGLILGGRVARKSLHKLAHFSLF